MLIDAEVLHRSCVDLHRSILKMDMVRCAFCKGRFDNIFPNSYWQESKKIMNMVQHAAKTLVSLIIFPPCLERLQRWFGAGRIFSKYVGLSEKNEQKRPCRKIQHFQKHLPKRRMKGKKSKCSTVIVFFVPILVVHFWRGALADLILYT